MDEKLKPFILYHGQINGIGAAQVEEACLQLAPHQPELVTLLLCSGGGDVNAGIGLYNFLRMLPFEIHTHAMGICGSIAATIFLAGKVRTATLTSVFTLHAASYVDGPRKGQVSENTQIISMPFRTELAWDEDRIANFFGTANESYIRVEDAIGMGIIHAIDDVSLKPESLVVRINPSQPTPINLALGRATTA